MSLATPSKIRELQIKLYRKAKNEPGYRFYMLYDKIFREDILSHAYQMADLHHQFLVATYLGATLSPLPRLQTPLASGVETGPGQVPDRDHPCHTVQSVTGRRNGAAHGFDFQNAKGR